MLQLQNLFTKVNRLARNFLTDFRFGGRFLGGNIPTRYAEVGAYPTGNSDYSALSIIFKSIEVRDSDVLVDIGCGKGRVINWWLSRGFKNKIYGIELDENIAEIARNRLKKYGNVNIISGDAVENIPSNGTIFYLYNPFNATVMERFSNHLIKLFNEKPIKVIYYNPIHIEIFRKEPRWIIDYFDIKNNSELQEILKSTPYVHSFAIMRFPNKGQA
jgi:SAM-dependent methyltransferase